MRRNRTLKLLHGGLFGLTLSLAGCKGTPVAQTVSKSIAASEVKVSSNGRVLGEAQPASLSSADLVQRVRELLTANQTARATRVVQRFPDVSLETLRGATGQVAQDTAIQFIAQAYDEHWGAGTEVPGWHAALQDRTREPRRYEGYEESRRKVVENARKGRAKEAAEVLLCSALDKETPMVLWLDGAHVEAEALLQAGQPTLAVKVLESVLTDQAGSYPHQGTNLLLLLSESQRRCGNEQQAITRWREAVALAGETIRHQNQVGDPVLWERVASMRPVRTPWPGLVAQRLNGTERSRKDAEIQTVAATGKEGDADEATLWLCIGHSRLARNEAQAALLAYKRAELFNKDAAWLERVQLQQARSLIELGQVPAAQAVLVPLAGKEASPMRGPAMALLGALKYKTGQVQQGLTLLRRAVENDANIDWDGRSDAEADLGLAYLTTGQEEKGLRWLRSARKRYESEGNRAAFLQSLENEAVYLEHTGKRAEAKSLREKAKERAGT